MRLDNRLTRAERAFLPAGRRPPDEAWLRTLSDAELDTLERLVAAKEAGQALSAAEAQAVRGFARRYLQFIVEEGA